MDEAQIASGVGFFGMLVIGVVAGWIAERVHGADHGLLTNLLVGVAGAFVAGKLAEVFRLHVYGFWSTLIAATVGAILVLWAWRLVRGQGR
jgi:uncharacterized membrane protein YeaQ/YmgE (transglycosylase-associated protein family)